MSGKQEELAEDQMSIGSVFWEFLSRDVAYLGGPDSPMLSWLGACGIVLFFMWHAFKLRKETASVRAAFARIHPMLLALAKQRGQGDIHQRQAHPKKEMNTQAGQTASTRMRVDSDDLQTLDAGFQHEPLFRGPWAQYRMSLIQEQVPWFVEPRIFSTKPAAEVLTQERLFTRHVNLAFYRQFPSLVTGIGLLLTFLALFIGLGKLHAEGNEIVGIQGLINGLAGKFLTSIVGLIVANVFTFMEKGMVSRLMNAHQAFLSTIDQVFPRKTLEQMVEQLTAIHRDHPKTSSPHHISLRQQAGEGQTNHLTASLANLTATLHGLSKGQQKANAETQRTLAEIPRRLSNELHAPLNELTNALHTLTRLLTEAKSHPVSIKPPFEGHSHLWKATPYPRGSSPLSFFERLSSWPGRSWLFRHRRTG